MNFVHRMVELYINKTNTNEKINKKDRFKNS